MGTTNTEVKPETDKQKAARLKREAKALEAEAAAKKAEAQATIGQPTEVVKPQRVRKVAKATGHGLTTTGRAIIDTDLRDIGQGVKRFGRFLKSHTPSVSIEKAHTCDDPSCPHGTTDAA